MHLVFPVEQIWLVSFDLVFQVASRHSSDWSLSQRSLFRDLACTKRKDNDGDGVIISISRRQAFHWKLGVRVQRMQALGQ